jgi:tape measure domain-containing protein
MGLLAEMTIKYTVDLSDVTAGISKLKADMSTAGTTTQASTGGMLSGFKSAAGGLLDFGAKLGQTVIGVKGLADGAIGLGQALIGGNASMEQTQVAFQTLLGSSKAAGDYLQQLQGFAASTPFEFPEVATAAQHMIAFGFSAKDVIPTLTDIGDAMSAMGKSTPEIESVVAVFGQMKAAGRVNAQDMMQLSSQGIPAWKFLAQAMHMTIPEVQALSQKGLLPADKAIQALRAGMHNMFGGGMAAQATTFNGLMSTLQDNVGSAMRAFTGPLFAQAKTGLTQLGNLVTSPAFQKFATSMGQQLGQGLAVVAQVMTGYVVPGFQKLIQIGSQVVAFFQQNRAAMIALQAIGIAIAGGLIALLVVGFYAWAVAAGTAAIATLALTWPILAIGAAIALVVVGVVLAIQHWSQITAFFQGIWGAFVGWLSTTWGQISGAFMAGVNGVVAIWQNGWNSVIAWFQTLWGNVVAIVQGVWIALQAAFSAGQTRTVTGFQTFWNGLVNVVKIGALLVLSLFLGPWVAIGAAFIWLYGHNTYVKALCDNIRSAFQSAIAWLQSAWSSAVGFLGQQWQNLVALGRTAWTAVSTAISTAVTTSITWLRAQWTAFSTWISTAVWTPIVTTARTQWTLLTTTISTAVTTAIKFLQTQWTTATTWLNTQWKNLQTMAGTALTAVSNVFGKFWATYIQPKMTAFWTAFTGWWNGIVSQASSLGSKLISAVASGISSAGGAIGNAIHGAISAGLSATGFHNVPGFASGVRNFAGGWAVVGPMSTQRGPGRPGLPGSAGAGALA